MVVVVLLLLLVLVGTSTLDFAVDYGYDKVKP